MWPQEQEERDFRCSTDSEWDRAEAYQIGEQDRNRAWVLTDRDVWHANPFYKGPVVPHPDSYEDGEFNAGGSSSWRLEPDPSNYEGEVYDPWPLGDDGPF